MTSEQKFLLMVGESGAYEDDEFGGKEVFGFFWELLRLRAKTARATEVELLDGLMAAVLRHGGEEAKEDFAESFDKLGLIKSVVSDYLTFAHKWITATAEKALDDTIKDNWSDEIEDPVWGPREQGGSCDFIMCDPWPVKQ